MAQALEHVGNTLDDMEVSQPQLDFLASDAGDLACVAGFGSGKTFVLCVKILITMLDNPGKDVTYIAPTFSLIRDIFYIGMGDLLDSYDIPYFINKSEHIIYVGGLGKIICRSMERPELLIGFEVIAAFLDEYDIPAQSRQVETYRKIKARIRQKRLDGKRGQSCITTTPEGFKNTYKMFKKDPLPGSQLIQMSTYDNLENLPEGYIDSLRAMYPEQLIEAYLMGKFVNLTAGTVYYAFNREIHDTHYIERPREPVHIGMDFNVYNMAAIVHVIREKKAYATKELVGLRDTPDMIDAIKEIYPDRKIFIYPDASGGGTSSKSCTISDLTLLNAAGFRVRANASNPLIKNRVASLNNQIEASEYFVNTEKCPFYAECLEQQIYDPVTGLPDKKSGLDHPLDAGGYFNHFQNPIAKPTFSIGARA